MWETLADVYVEIGKDHVDTKVQCQTKGNSGSSTETKSVSGRTSSALHAANTRSFISSVAGVPSSIRTYSFTTPGVGEAAIKTLEDVYVNIGEEYEDTKVQCQTRGKPDRIDRPNVFRRQQAAIQPLIEIYERAAVRKLPQQVQVYPDYSMYPELTRSTAYGFLTRGCPRGCSFADSFISARFGKLCPSTSIRPIVTRLPPFQTG